MGAAGVKTHEVHFVRVDGTLLKRIRFETEDEAVGVESSLLSLGQSAHVPAIVRRDGRELWLEYIDGPPLDPRKHDGLPLLLGFYSSLYAGAGRSCSVDASPYPARLKDDLLWLESSGMLPASATASLARRAAAVEPRQVLLGVDFIDPVPKNFVIRGERLFGIDVEALKPDTLLGTGPAKALLRWLDSTSDEMTSRLHLGGSPDLAAQFDYAELCFRCSYARQKVLQRKAHLAPPSMFDRYLSGFGTDVPRALVAQRVS
jgi:hypothetical protein